MQFSQIFRVMGALLLLAAGLSVPAPGQAKSALFDSGHSLDITLELDYWGIVKHPSDDRAWPTTLIYRDDSGSEVRLPVESFTRGHSRRDTGLCEFPPLSLHFDKESTRGTLFEGQSKLKLTTHCQPEEKFEQYYAREHLAYVIYQQMTPYAVQTRPLSITYRKPGARRSQTRFGFVVEDIDDMAHDEGFREMKYTEIEPERLDPAATNRMVLFQYLIGNTDWAATIGDTGEDECCHNNKLIGDRDNPEFLSIPVPYDFDSSGLVDAEYALPPRGLGLRNVRQRLFRGFCEHKAQLPEAIAEYQAAESRIMQVVDNTPGLTADSRRKARKYLHEFFPLLEDQDKLLEACRG